MVKCPECVDAGQRSEITVTNCAVFAMGWAPFFDEDGGYHEHDPNGTGIAYRCSNGHEWGKDPECPNPTCTWPDKEPT